MEISSLTEEDIDKITKESYIDLLNLARLINGIYLGENEQLMEEHKKPAFDVLWHFYPTYFIQYLLDGLPQTNKILTNISRMI